MIPELMSSPASPTVLSHPTYTHSDWKKVHGDYSVFGFKATSRASCGILEVRTGSHFGPCVPRASTERGSKTVAVTVSR